MKKRVKLWFFGLALAISFSILVSCDNQKNGTDNTSSATQTATVTGTTQTNSQRYTVSFDNNGHGNKPEDQSNLTAIPSLLPVLTAKGYVFEGWYLDKSFTFEATPNEAIPGSLTLYAKWTPVTDSVDGVMISYIDSLIENTASYVPAWNKEGFKGKWNYIDGVFLNSIVSLYYDLCETNISKANAYKSFFLSYVDYYISSTGAFLAPGKSASTVGYTAGELDSVCESKILFDAYEMTGDSKYVTAIEYTINQLSSISIATGTPNFSHKEIYKNQIWLDGMYMYAPFYARYAKSINDSDIFETLYDQYKYIREHMYDEEKGLYYHGYDSTKSIFWADPVTGCSESFWLRSMGWYIVSLADVIEYFPNGEQKVYLNSLLKEAIDGILQYQDATSHMFYQLVDKGPEKVTVSKDYLSSLGNSSYMVDGKLVDAEISNYLESSGSSMIAYAITKAVNKGYLADSYLATGKEIFDGVYNHSFKDNELNDICITAGLGPETKTYRDGSAAYYLAEKVGSNDAKGVGPFIMAYLEYQRTTPENRPTPYLYTSSINEVIESTTGEKYTTIGTVMAIYAQGFIISDESGTISVYMGSSWTVDVSIGDILKIEGVTTVYNKGIQFGNSISYQVMDNTSVSYPITLLTTFHLDDYITNETLVSRYFEGEGTVLISGSYYNLVFEGTDVVGSIQYPLDSSKLINGDKIKFKGYTLNLTSSGSTKYLKFVMVSSTKVEEVVPTDEKVINILSVNDLHGYIMQNSNNMYGISNMAAKITSIRNENDYDDVVLIANGDLFQGTAISNMTKGKAVLDAMNLMGFDAMGIGNHEFDWGINYILQYFDKNPSNGEANFPLLNANIYYQSNNTLVSISNGNILRYTIVEKQGVKICIVSYIGDVMSSIEASKTKGYYFNNDIVADVANTAGALKMSGLCDLVIVNIHDGGTTDASQYEINNRLAALKTSDDRYVVDAIINGHTHYYYDSIITRNGVDLPVVQAGCNGQYLGRMTLKLNQNNEVVSATSNVIFMSSVSNYDSEVEASVDNSYSTLPIENLCVAKTTISSKSSLEAWKASVGLAITGADVFLSNDGGIRSAGGITSGKSITNADLYEISPFDNDIWLMTIKYTSSIQSLLNIDSLFYGVKDGVTLTIGQTYTFAIESYVYLKYSQLTSVSSSDDINTGLIMRDYMIEDLTIRGKSNQQFDPINNYKAVVGYKLPEKNLYALNQPINVFIAY